MFCRNCGKEVAEQAVMCVHCGVPPRNGTKFCWNCGESTDPVAEFCVKCGAGLKAAPASGTQYKSKMAAGLLGIFLGALGIHRFYLGYTAIGLIQLLVSVIGGIVTCGIAAAAVGVWGLVEGILILTGSINKDAQGNPLVD